MVYPVSSSDSVLTIEGARYSEHKEKLARFQINCGNWAVGE